MRGHQLLKAGQCGCPKSRHLRLQLVAGPLRNAAKVVCRQQVHVRQARRRQVTKVAAPCASIKAFVVKERKHMMFASHCLLPGAEGRETISIAPPVGSAWKGAQNEGWIGFVRDQGAS